MNQEQNILTPRRNDQGETIKHEIKKYLSYWYWFVLGIILAFIGAYLYLRYTPKIYSSSAKIKILNKTKGLELPSSAFVFNRSNINLENEIEILKSYRIIEDVVKKLDLTVEYYEEGNILTTQIDQFPFKFTKTKSNDSIINFSSYKIVVKANEFQVFRGESDKAIVIPNHNSYNVNHNLPFELQFEHPSQVSASVDKTFLLKFIPVPSATRKLKSNINVNKLGKDSDLLTLSYSSQSRSLASTTINNVVEVFNNDGVTDRQQVSKRTIDFIDERFKYLAFELDSIEIGIKDFKKSNNIINIETDADLGLSQRTVSENQVFEVENQLVISDLLSDTMNQSDSDLLPANVGIDNANINGLISQHNDLVFERNKLVTSAGENNPTVKILNDKLASVKSNIKTSLNSYELQLNATKQQLVRKNQKYAYQVSSLPLKEKLLRSRERQQAIKQSLYLFLLQKREEAAINLAITEPSIKVVEYALSSGSPISPNSKNIYLFALVAGLFLPFASIYAYNLLDTKIKGKDDVTVRVGNIPILAELPRIKNNKNLVFDNPTDRSVQSEAFRILSANVNYIIPTGEDAMGKVIYCTSTIKGEGKTYVGINLSLALSSINKKVLLVGADLRNPQIHSYISKDKNLQGLSNYLHDDTLDWKRIVVKGFEKHPNHEILLSGDIPPNPTQLLTNGRFETLLNEAKQVYDYIIIDTAPTILVTDTLLISKHADATIYLLRADHTEKNLLEFSKNLSDSGKIKNMAYVINGVGSNKSYGYNYGYNYGYGSKN
ncbi:GumC family protein [Psychroserpens algicola]|uniref:non-specific protein-tyrosine kinase n=1 Tax=Psychroserpens algicola TaxID=1719034 RepID=A0ABT0H866_9FLAO|nr:tyrosine-protein kinase domain-containing protein [Psychroserpens algicola]MCK8480561.1 polysaccharide biosynthesis tyrosine autokinase [Psychroserpens algicola]